MESLQERTRSQAPARPITVTKRAIDLVVASTLLLALAPLLLVLLVLVGRTGPCFFRQDRLGERGRRIRIVKLRTMVADAERWLERDPVLRRTYEEHGYKLPADIDPRITRVGRVLRATSLDELPQLLSVIRGDLSMVGPRPIVPDELQEYERRGALDAYLAVRPGLTGLWQVSGRSATSYDERVELDRTYLAIRSTRTDLAIMWRTVGAVLSRRGAH